MADDAAKPIRNRFRKIEVRMWGDEKFRALSPLPPCGQGLWVFLLTGPHTGPIPGVFRSGRAAMAEELDWEMEAFDKAFAEAFRQGLVRADWKAKVVWIPNAIKCNRPESPNVVRSWGSEWDLIPECDLKREAYESLRANICGLGEGFEKAFFEAFGKPSPKPSPKTCANQEQEQEQEQKHSAPSDAPSKFDALKRLVEGGVPRQIAEDWLKTRKRKRLELTQTALDGIVREAGKAGLSLDSAIRLCGENGWAGFKASWLNADGSANGRAETDNVFG